jgi:NAD(P)-dependent dehydrogenase (short-subunit alcohol dehydrogenase family)
MANWTAEQIPDQTGRVVIVTGGNIGLGYESVLALAKKGAEVVMASRNLDKANAARREILAQVPNGKVEVMQVDLSDLASIRAFSEAFHRRYSRLDILLNNAGLMIPPYGTTKDGFETQFGVNHLGHFALTGLLLDVVLATPNSRVVTVSSNAYRGGRINFDDLQSKQKYSAWGAYSQSKVANIHFMRELQLRLDAIGSMTISVSAHPGYSATDLQNPQKVAGVPFVGIITSIANRFFAQSAAMGALSQLYAATAPNVKGGEFFGPDKGMRGYPTLLELLPHAMDRSVESRLWAVSEALTGVKFKVLEPTVVV